MAHPLHPCKFDPACDRSAHGSAKGRRGYCKQHYGEMLRKNLLRTRNRRKAGDGSAVQWIKNERAPWNSQMHLALLRELCRRDFWSFFLYAFGDGRSPKGQGWIDPQVHEPMARWAQQHADEWLENRRLGRGQQKHLAVVVHREVGKSRMFTAAFQLWLHLRDPELSSYTGSESTDLAMRVLSVMQGVLDGSDPYSMFQVLYGNWSTSARKWTGRAITHAARKMTSRADPSLGTFAVETSIVGAHPDAIFYDDPISYERMTSDSNWLRSVNSQVTSLFPVVQSDGLVVWVGTRYDDEDHFGVAFRDEGVASLTGMETDSIKVSPDGKWHVYFMAGRNSEDKPTTPKVWPETRLKDYQRRDPLRYAAQVMNDPSISEFNPLTRDQIRQCVVKPDAVPWTGLSYGITTDTAFWDGISRTRKDDTVFIVHGYPKNGSGDVYVVEVHGSPLWRSEDFAKNLVNTVQRYRRQGRRILGIMDEIPQGKVGSWKMALQNVFHDAGEPMPPFHEVKRQQGNQGNQKVQRMVAAAQYWVDGHVRVVEGAPGVTLLMEQMAKIGQYMVNPQLKNDYADAHADAFRPEFYQPMRRATSQRAPYDRNATAIEVEGLDRRQFEDDESRGWHDANPRPPIGGQG